MISGSYILSVSRRRIPASVMRGKERKQHRNVVLQMLRSGMRKNWLIFSIGIFRKVIAGDETAEETVRHIKEERKIYVPMKDLAGSRLLELIFRPVIKDQKSTSADQIKEFAGYQLEVISGLASRFCRSDAMLIESEFARAYYCDVVRLSSYGLSVLPATYIRLLEQVAGPETVPFKGEPLKGLQIMGPLETRALDFSNIVILSANEGSFPRKAVSSSFIPPELRRGFGLPTYEYQDAVWAYYFYRMIARAENVWMIYDSRTEGLHSGEESRFIKQLVYHFRLPVRRRVAGAGIGEARGLPDIPKTEEDVLEIRRKDLSATSLQNYLSCPAKFYYGTVKGLKAEEEVAESLDTATFGTVYHNVMWALFAGEEAMAMDDDMDRRRNAEGKDAIVYQERVTLSYLRSWLDRGDEIRRKVRSLICSQIKTPEVTGRNLVVADVIVRYVLKTIERDIELLADNGADAFTVIGTEQIYMTDYRGFHFKGYLDRVDSFSPGQIRVCDYKTGKVSDDDIVIDDGNADRIADAVFGDDNARRPKIALQFFIYDLLLRENGVRAEILNSVYQTSGLFREKVKAVPVSGRFYSLMEERLASLLDELADTAVPFRRTEDAGMCEYCDFRKICGR